MIRILLLGLMLLSPLGAARGELARDLDELEGGVLERFWALADSTPRGEDGPDATAPAALSAPALPAAAGPDLRMAFVALETTLSSLSEAESDPALDGAGGAAAAARRRLAGECLEALILIDAARAALDP